MTWRNWFMALGAFYLVIAVLNWVARCIVLWLKWRVRRAEMRARGRL